MKQSEIANMAQKAALRTVQSNIGNLNGFSNCPACVATSMLGDCDCHKKGVAKCASCKHKKLGSWTKEFGSWTKEFGDWTADVWTSLPYILVTGALAGFVGWELGKRSKKFFGARKRRKK